VFVVRVRVLVDQETDDRCDDHEGCESSGLSAETPYESTRALGCCQNFLECAVLDCWRWGRFEAGDLAAQVEKVSAHLLAVDTTVQVALDFACFRG
jgi:hypothetical protein